MAAAGRDPRPRHPSRSAWRRATPAVAAPELMPCPPWGICRHAGGRSAVRSPRMVRCAAGRPRIPRTGQDPLVLPVGRVRTPTKSGPGVPDRVPGRPAPPAPAPRPATPRQHPEPGRVPFASLDDGAARMPSNRKPRPRGGPRADVARVALPLHPPIAQLERVPKHQPGRLGVRADALGDGAVPDVTQLDPQVSRAIRHEVGDPDRPSH